MKVRHAKDSGGGEVPDSSDGADGRSPRYKWIALTNTTLGVLMASIDATIVLISLPAIFRGIDLNPLSPGNVSYLLWMLLGYLVVTSVLVVTLGRFGDMYGRVKMYNIGFAIFTVASVGLSVIYTHGPGAALTLILFRLVQALGGAMVMANSGAILTDAFPVTQRGMALGINSVAGIAGSFIGLVLGGVLSAIDWHLVFLVSVPVGVVGTAWAYWKLQEIGGIVPGKIDWWGNLTFGVGLISILLGITYGIQPSGGKDSGWTTNHGVQAALIGGVLTMLVFCWVESRAEQPMFHLKLFKIRAFTAGNIASLLSSMGRGGLQFMLIVWLQGIWLPLHGYDFRETPLWAGIYMLPLSMGFLIAGPISGILSDRFGARYFATGGMILAAATYGFLLLLPVNFSYPVFAIILLINGISMGAFASPNGAAIMNSVPANERGIASGLRSTFMNTGQTLSISLFFSIMVIGLASVLPVSMFTGLVAQGVPSATAQHISHLPPVSLLFAAFLGYNPIQTLLGPAIAQVPVKNIPNLIGRSYFPHLISEAFHHGLIVVFVFAMVMLLVAAAASWMRGERYVWTENDEPTSDGSAGGDGARTRDVASSAASLGSFH